MEKVRLENLLVNLPLVDLLYSDGLYFCGMAVGYVAQRHIQQDTCTVAWTRMTNLGVSHCILDFGVLLSTVPSACPIQHGL